MKRLIVALLLCVATAGAVRAQGWAADYSLSNGTVTVSNGQANSSWVPVAALIRFGGASTGSVEILRLSGGGSFRLGNCAFTNVTTVVWTADADYSFGIGEALVIQCTATNGVVQVMRKAK